MFALLKVMLSIKALRRDGYSGLVDDSLALKKSKPGSPSFSSVSYLVRRTSGPMGIPFLTILEISVM